MITITRPRLVALALLCVVVLPARGWAQGPCSDQALPAPPATGAWNPGSPFLKLLVLNGQDCLGGAQDKTAIVVKIRAPLTLTIADGDAFKKSVITALSGVMAHATAASDQFGNPMKEAALQIGLAAATLDSGISPSTPADWTLDKRVPAVSLELEDTLASACKTGPNAGCQSQFELTRELLRVAGLTRSILSYYAFPTIKAHQQATAVRAAQWEAYFDTARSQYPWELVLNGAVMSDTRTEVNGVKLGFRDVPTTQWLLLHPYVAFEYAEDEPEGNRFAGVVLVDVLGYNRWSWKKDGSMGLALGASAILVMGDHANMDDIGWGAMLHVNHKFSVGVTFLGDTQTFLVSGDVAQLWTKVSEFRKKKMMTGQ